MIDAIRSRILVRVGDSLDEAMSMRVYDAIVRLPLKIGSQGDGAQPIRDLDTVRGFLSGVGPVALFDLPWMPIYLAICFLFHPYIGLTALAGAIILVALTVRDRIADAAADPQRHAIRRGAQHADGSEPAQRRGDHGDGHGRPHRASAGAISIATTWPRAAAPATSPAALARCRRCLRMLLQSAILAVGAWLVIHQESTPGIIIAGSILGARALAPVDLAIANWRGFVARAAKLAAAVALARPSAAADRADAAAAADTDAGGAERRRCAAGRAKDRLPGRQLHARRPARRSA